MSHSLSFMTPVARKLVFAGLLFFSAADLHAADVERLKALFEKNFHTFYQEGKCGQNIERLVRAAVRQGIDLSGAEVVHLENQGLDTFGMVAAHQARETVDWDGNRVGIDMNWFFHVVLLADGYVFDFDFRNVPTVLDVRSYFYENFLPTKKKQDFGFRSGKLGSYLLTLYSVRAADPEESSSPSLLNPPRTFYMREYLKDWFLPQ